ncbi:MAG: hypothetical protein SNJ52_02355, partial [Verrucomicrobiia bacterium]
VLKHHTRHAPRHERALQNQLSAAQETIQALTESMAVATAEAELFRREYEALRLKTEALGLEALGADKSAIEQRLLQAVNDLRLERERVAKLETQIITLIEAVMAFNVTTEGGDPELRLAVEEQMRLATALVENFELRPSTEFAGGSLTDSRVISVKREWSLVVGDIGSRQGLRVGMPLEVIRDGRKLAQVLAVDVRERIFGGVIQPGTNTSDQILVGDRMRVATR